MSPPSHRFLHTERERNYEKGVAQSMTIDFVPNRFGIADRFFYFTFPVVSAKRPIVVHPTVVTMPQRLESSV